MDPRELFELIKANPLIAVWLVLLLLGGLGRMIGGERGKAGRTPRDRSAPTSEPRPGASELEERIRRNFEEMLRRRAQQQSPQPPEPPRAPAQPMATLPRERALEGRSLETVPTQPRGEPTRVRPRPVEATRGDSTARVRKSAGAAPPKKARLRPLRSHATAPRALSTSSTRMRHAPATALTRRPRPAQLKNLDHAALRRAIVLREVLEPPLALRATPTPET